MPMPKDQAIVKTYEAPKTSKVKIADIMPSTRVDTFDWGEIQYPYMITISNGKSTVMAEESTGVFSPKKWDKYFFINKMGFVQYSRYRSFSAILWILQKNETITIEKGVDFDINSLIGKEFGAVLVEYGDAPFIDWTKTLEANGFEIPELGAKKEVKKEETKEEETLQDDDLPF